MIEKEADWQLFGANPIGDRQIAKILKNYLKYTYKKASMTYGDPTKPEFEQYRSQFKVLF